MKEYLDLCSRIIKEGTWVSNARTGKRCLTVIDANLTYDVSDNKLPVLTTKKLFWKPAIAEMLGYLRGYTSAAEFRKLGCNTWNANSAADIWVNSPHWVFDGDMGRAYGAQARNWISPRNPPVKITRKIVPQLNQTPIERSPNNYGNSDIIPDNDVDRNLRGIWYSMHARCYNQKHKEYHNYGGKGVFVHLRWHKLSNFILDVKRLPNWFFKERDITGYELDKDYYGSNCYSPDTCMWLTVSDNRLYAQSKGLFLLTEPDGKTHKYISMNQAARDFNLNRGHISSCLSENRKHHKKFTFKWLDTENIYRYQAPIDQLKKVYNNLKQGIDDRSEIITFMNPGERDMACLNACMHTHTFSILDGSLYLTSYQRSNDVPLGHGFNQVQVAWLLLIMAQITGLKPGKAFHKIVNAHIYEDQLDLLRDVQLEREPFPSPTLRINPDIKSLEDLETWVTLDDFELHNYEHHPAIKYPFSV